MPFVGHGVEKTGRWKRPLLGAVLIVALTATATVAVVLLEVKHVADLIGPATLHPTAGVITAAQAGAAETILVIGTDARALSKDAYDRLNPPHSDTLLLIRMDPARSQTSELSVPRDLRTTIDAGRLGVSTQKINAAYTLGSTLGGPGGGADLAARTVESTLPGIQINHIILVNFAGFRKLIDAIGCVYIYVDRHYYNVNIGTVATDYSSIDIQPGYQKLCGETALDYVRYRHTDSDFVRVARQQDFVRQAKQQIGVAGLIGKEDQLLKALRSAAQTDIHGTAEIFHLFTLAAFSLGRPIRQVTFQADRDAVIGGVSYVTATPAQIQATVADFLHGSPPTKIAVPSLPLTGRNAARKVAALGLTATPASDIGLANASSVGLPFRMYAPRLRLQNSQMPDDIRAYRLPDERGLEHSAYVISIFEGELGEYYGVEGTDWLDPPILAGAHQSLEIARRTYDVYLDGSHVRLVAWRAGKAVYWINNTLDTLLTNSQMLAIAESSRPIA
jgi:polyisoprenyl-teichoic acid--peptidoglycan teichoic acid transferase